MRQSIILFAMLLWFSPLFGYQSEPEHWLVEMGLAHELSLSQTVEDVTITLDWAYADTQGFAVQVTFENLSPELQEALFNSVSADAKLWDTLGNEFSSQGSEFGPTGNVSAPFYAVFSYYPQAIAHNTETDEWLVDNDYFENQFESLPAELTLQFELNLGDPSTLYPPMPGPDGQMMPTAEPAFASVGPFVFDFNVPLPAPIELEINQAVELNDLTMSLESIAITPAFAESRICIELPDASDWQPQATIIVNGAAGAMSGSGITDMAQFENQERRCFNLRFHAPHNGPAEQVVVSLDAIEKSMSEGPSDWEQIQTVLAEQGIEMIVNAEDHGIGLEMPNLPEDMTYQDAIDLAREQLGDRIVGPWLFTFDLS